MRAERRLMMLPALADRMHDELSSRNGNLAFAARVAEMISGYGFGKPGQQLPIVEQPAVDPITDEKYLQIEAVLAAMGFSLEKQEARAPRRQEAHRRATHHPPRQRARDAPAAF